MTAEHSAALAGRDKSETVNTTRTAVQDLPGNESRKADSVGLPGTKWTPHPSRKSNRRSRRFMRKLEKLLHPNKEKRRRPSNATPNSNRSLKLDETSDDESSQDEAVHSVCTRPCIKIRLATFNMHESLPSGGDLGDFLGDLSEANFGKQGRSNSSASSNRRRHVKQEFDQDRRWSTTSRSSTTAVDESLPVLPLDERHPYHLLVIAGQECEPGIVQVEHFARSHGRLSRNRPDGVRGSGRQGADTGRPRLDYRLGRIPLRRSTRRPRVQKE